MARLEAILLRCSRQRYNSRGYFDPLGACKCNIARSNPDERPTIFVSRTHYTGRAATVADRAMAIANHASAKTLPTLLLLAAIRYLWRHRDRALCRYDVGSFSFCCILSVPPLSLCVGVAFRRAIRSLGEYPNLRNSSVSLAQYKCSYARLVTFICILDRSASRPYWKREECK